MKQAGLILSGVFLLVLGGLLTGLVFIYADKEEDDSDYYYLFFSEGLMILSVYFLVKGRKEKRKKSDNYVEGEEQLSEMNYFEYEKYTPALWAAKFGHLLGSGDLRNYYYENKEFEKWVHELFQILHTEDLAQLRLRLLTKEEQEEVAKEITNGF